MSLTHPRPLLGAVHKASIQILTMIPRWFIAPDVFISYARRDASAYAESLANTLAGSQPPFACFIDQWESQSGIKIPTKILRAARWSKARIVIASPDSLNSDGVN